MSFWRKIAGLAVRKVDAAECPDCPAGPPGEDPAFSTAVTALGAKLAKADGRADHSEFAAFAEVFQPDPAAERDVERLYDLARQSTRGFESYARRLAKRYRGCPQLLEDVLDGLFHIAKSDGVVTHDELDYLEQVALMFGLSPLAFRRIKAIHLGAGADDPYVVLDVAADAPDEAVRAAWRRALAAAGYSEAVTWSFTARKTAELFGGGAAALVLANPIAAELDCMRPSILPNLIEAAGRNAKRGFADAALFEIGPVFGGDQPQDQRLAISAILAPHGPRRWDGAQAEDVFTIKADLIALLDELGAPTANLQVAQGAAAPWWHPGRSARLQLGPKAVIAEFGALHPAVLKALDVDGPVYGFEVFVETIPEPKKKPTKTKPALALSPLMPLSRDFAFVVAKDKAAGDLTKAVAGADKALIAAARVFDVYEGKGVEDGFKSLAVEVTIQPREATLTEAEIEALSAKIVAAAEKATGAKLRG